MRISILQQIVIPITFCSLFIPVIIQAETTENKTVTFDEIVVTATKNKEKIEDTPASISVIKAEDLEQAPNLTLDEAFRYTPSIQIFRGEGVGTIHNFISIRGIGDSRNLLYVDGVSMVESMSGNTNLSFLPTSGVDRIEILRGPSSALYGGGGMGGVINIMTQTPEPGAHGSLKTVFGNFGYQKYEGMASYGAQKYSLSLDLSDTKTDNYYSRDTLLRRDYNYQTGIYTYDYHSDYEKAGHVGWKNWNRDYHEKTAKIKAEYKPDNDTKIDLVAGLLDNETGTGYTDRYKDATGNTVEKYLEKEKNYLGLTGETRLPGNSTLGFRLTYKNSEYRNYGENMNLALPLDNPAQIYDPPGPSPAVPVFYSAKAVQGADDYEAELKWSVPLSLMSPSDHMLTLGTQYTRSDIYWSIERQGSGQALTTPVDTTKDAKSVYLQDEFFINKAFTLTTGLRGDFYDDFDNQLSPKISLLYKHDPTTQFFLSGGYAYNPPSYSDKFGTSWNMTSYTIRTNNPDLKPETLRSVEIGARKSLAGIFKGSIAAFYCEADDLIESMKESRQIGSSSVYMTYEYPINIDKATMKGVESEFKLDLTTNHQITGNLTYMQAENDATGKRLERSPNWLGSIAYHYRQPFGGNAFWSTIRGRGQSGIYLGEYSVDEPRDVDGFFVWDLSLGVDIGTHITLSTGITNLFDTDYREFTYTIYRPGRTWTIGAEYRF